MREDLREFATTLLQLLSARGMSQAALSDETELSASTITNWCKGSSRPGRQNIEKAEDALSVPRGHLTRLAGYLPAAEPPRAETLKDFLERQGVLGPEQIDVLISVYENFLKVPPPKRGGRAGR